jgi:hypothetical protein
MTSIATRTTGPACSLSTVRGRNTTGRSSCAVGRSRLLSTTARAPAAGTHSLRWLSLHQPRQADYESWGEAVRISPLLLQERVRAHPWDLHRGLPQGRSRMAVGWPDPHFDCPAAERCAPRHVRGPQILSARGGTRTRKPFRAMAFEAIAFAEFRHPGRVFRLKDDRSVVVEVRERIDDGGFHPSTSGAFCVLRKLHRLQRD